MHFLRRRLRPLTWIALVTMLGLGLLPAASHALASVGGRGDWLEVCTAGGLARVAADDAPASSNSPLATVALEHCPYCTPGTPVAGLPVAPPQAWLAPSTSVAAPAREDLPPGVRAAWARAQPRAPPAGP